MVRGIVSGLMCVFLWGCTLGYDSVATLEDPNDGHPALQRKTEAKRDSQDPNDVATNWFYGQGLGEAVLNIAGVWVFPPYALYVVGNGVAQVAGYEPFSVVSALPEDVGTAYEAGYNEVAGAPGRVTAALSGREYRSNEAIQSRNRSASDARGTTDQEFGYH